MTTKNETTERATSSLISTGAGIAIAGIWLATGAVSIIFMLIMFVWTDDGTTSSETSTDAAMLAYIILFLMIAAPLIAAYSITKKILDKDD